MRKCNYDSTYLSGLTHSFTREVSIQIRSFSANAIKLIQLLGKLLLLFMHIYI